mmetsp:Transcript_47883/g.35096  ORF Transcript_47883/g.35096 Transcript_47883/m.35096 type:complete len:87 (+) Transcript_47883:1377-1637(+)|eukprot:CAMPEP_0202959504 /NCGR_PEP_ID=MMETSP1396-20130829/3678_1 /ASSEMBLY_ACC=CAM_ASM_000872 /TAXON_ID= /ORGANISM="Pseudokeronopsis sp., Strain Brazil" /LENGTH=86 /DNA_ID=CAMNT_0049678085 /DNA_START=1357 /DNA_END=1617 /DNA_ORIENTATION=+
MITNILNEFDVDFFMPISMIDANMDRAHARDGLLTQKFFWKTSGLNSQSFDKNNLKDTNFLASNSNESDQPDTFHELYISEILEGK